MQLKISSNENCGILFCHGIKKASVNLTTVRFTTVGGELEFETVWILPYLYQKAEHRAAGKKYTGSVSGCNYRQRNLYGNEISGKKGIGKTSENSSNRRYDGF